MIKNTVNDPLQEEMLVKQFNEECAAVGESEYGFGEAADMMYTAEIAQAFNALMESVGIAELQFYNKYGAPLVMKEETEGEGDAAADSKGGEDAGSEDGGDEKKAPEKDKAKAMAADAQKVGGAVVTRVRKILDGIIAFIQKLWNSAKNALQEIDVANKAFAAKYAAQLGSSEYKNKVVTLKSGYHFNIRPAQDALDKLKGCESRVSSLAEKVAGGNGKIDAAKTTLRMYVMQADNIDKFKAKLKTPVDHPQGNAGTAINGLKATGGAIKVANKIFAQTSAQINKFKNRITADEKGKIAGELYIEAGNMAKSILSAYVDTLKDSARQDRAICAAALRWKSNDAKKAKDAAAAEKAAAKEAKKNAENTEKAGGGEEKAEEKSTEESARLQDLSVNDMLEMFSFA